MIRQNIFFLARLLYSKLKYIFSMKSFILMVITMVCAISLEAQNKSFYDFNVTTIDGKEFSAFIFEREKGVGSKCSF